MVLSFMKVTSRMIRFAAAGLLLTLGACGGGGDGSGGGVTPPPPPPPQTGIGPAGGTVLGPNGARVEIPPGALATNTAIAIEQTSTGSPPLPGGFATSGLMFAFTPHGTTFAVPVTITLPFDPTSVPAGTAPALFKTNAQNQWEQVANATFGATSVTAQITSFSFGQILHLSESFGDVRSEVSFHELLAKSGLGFIPMDGGEESGSDFSRVYEFGFADFDSGFLLIDGTLVPSNRIANGVVSSSADGGTFQVLAEAPIGNERVPGDVIGGMSRLVQVQTYIKREEEATLTFTMPNVRIEMHDENAILGRTCPGTFCFKVLGFVEFTLEVFNLPSPDAVPSFYTLEGHAHLGGLAKDWKKDATTSGPSMLPVWNDGLFDLSIESINGADESKAVYTLRERLSFEVPVSNIEVGEQFNVRITFSASAKNFIGGAPSELPTSAGVYLNFPDSETGGGAGPITVVTSTGLEPVDTPSPLPEPPPLVLVPPAPCVPGPGSAGTLQFSADGYSLSEAETDVPTITVTRTAGTTGAVTATFSTVGGTAVAGTDFTGVTSTVFFADGDNTPRVVDVPILDDNIGEPGETVNLTLSQPGGCAVLGARSAAVLTIQDDDELPPGPSGLDPTFDTDGKATANAFGGDRSGMTVQSDGKVVMVGGTFSDFIMARFNADGSLDDNFGDDGKVTTSMINGGQEESLGVAIQPDNKIVVVGYSGPSGRDPSVTLARYLPNGTLDDTFGVDGKAFTSVVGRAFAVALQPDGKIVIAGDVPSTEDFLIARFNANGGSDFSFANGGLTTDINVGSDLASNLVLQPDGFIVISGPHTNFGETTRDQHTGLMRVDSNGILDGTFGAGGKLLLTGKSVGEGLALQSDGKLVLAGRVNVAVPPLLRNEFALMRLRADGTPDGTFGVGGQVITPITTLGDAALAVALQADGKIIAAGASRSQVNPNFAVARYDTAGVLDPSFGNGGTLEIDFFGFTDIAESVVVQSDGKIVLGGLARNNVDGYGVARVVP